jgi:hypothetical protein
MARVKDGVWDELAANEAEAVADHLVRGDPAAEEVREGLVRVLEAHGSPRYEVLEKSHP